MGLNLRQDTFYLAYNILSEVIPLLVWLGINRFYLHIRIRFNQKTPGKAWLLLSPIVLVMISDFANHPKFSIAADNIILAVLFGFSTALMEEYVFRGIFIGGFKDNFHLSPLWTAVLSGATFGGVHLINVLNNPAALTATLLQVIYAMGMGLFFAVIYLLSANIWLPVMAHGLIDTFDGLLYGSFNSSVSNPWFFDLALALIFVVLAVIFWQRRTKLVVN
ncbi:immunity protein PlnI, membrane-bound protease CAAX family [Agrilactobacillus composti DSM 18527 = JCM 14202]|nr:immunity protein PlnI, membrane-bound protease CAAX family [Agrilactobacillus composti DSM 18527 = JCM 14202]